MFLDKSHPTMPYRAERPCRMLAFGTSLAICCSIGCLSRQCMGMRRACIRFLCTCLSTSIVCQPPSPLPPRPPPPLYSSHPPLVPDAKYLALSVLVAVASQAKSSASVSVVPRSSYKHLPCGQKCDRTLLCGHACGIPCHGGSTCPPCTHPCAAKCVHSQCQGHCTDMCAPCAEPCPWHCDHQACSLWQCPLPWLSFMSSCIAYFHMRQAWSFCGEALCV